MGWETLVYGAILCPDWRREVGKENDRLNADVIAALPNEDDWPFLTRPMFHFVDAEVPFGRWKSGVILFGGSFKEIEYQWEEWLEKFEALLRRLYWREAHLSIRPRSGIGWYDYNYRALDYSQHIFNDSPKPIESWEFEGGPRKLC